MARNSEASIGDLNSAAAAAVHLWVDAEYIAARQFGESTKSLIDHRLLA